MDERNEILSKVSDSAKYKLAYEQEEEAGLYPDHFDPQFISHLVKKLEFADTLSKEYNPDESPCLGNEEFETTPVQRFVASFLHPQTPYRGMLLYHGVGVGKTCAAILTAEGYLEQFPYKKVIIVAPRNIQPGFFRTIFDSNRLKLGKAEDPNTIGGCLENKYLLLTNNLFTRDKAKIERDVLKLIKKRYSFFGYLQFANHIRSIVNKVVQGKDKKETDSKVALAIRREFNYHLVIIDEAHNLRDIDGIPSEEDADTVDISESKAGKLLTPQLNNILKYGEGIKLMLMTATPMFNNVREITFLLNRFMINEKRKLIEDGEIFNANGELMKDAVTTLGKYASAYISFMRGENPNSFPLRLKPFNHPNLSVSKEENKIEYPMYAPQMISKDKEADSSFSNNAAEFEKIKGMLNLPFYCSYLSGYNEQLIAKLVSDRSGGALNFTNLDPLIQADTVIFPGDGQKNINENADDYVGGRGFEATFVKTAGRYKMKSGTAKWLLNSDTDSSITEYSPKVGNVLKLLQKCKGVAFTYSRFVRTGALFVSLALEANGYTAYDRDNGLLFEGNQNPLGRQCALCNKKEKEHSGSDHAFVAAKYILLTGDQELSPMNAKMIDAARSDKNKDGSIIKVIVGSQIAAEGLDLKFIREIHILDPWFHLNKTEQIIGRGIRFCSHSAINDQRLHNTTIFLHVSVFTNYSVETADLYSYRVAYKKALQIGEVSRVLKEYAIDCNLRSPATVINTTFEREVIDSQNNERGLVNLSDVPYSPLCDWLSTCEISCKPAIDISQLENIDTSTYNIFSARFRESLIRKQIVELFEAQTSYQIDGFEKLLHDQTGAPEIAISMVLRNIIGNKSYVIKNESQRGYISIRNGYYVFQPLMYKDKNLPAALRIADLPIKRDKYIPDELQHVNILTPEQEALIAEKDVGQAVTTTLKTVSIWPVLSEWIRLLSTGKLKITAKVENAIENFTDENRALRKIYMERLAILLYFFSIDDIDVESAKKAALEYVWDGFLSRSDQIKSLETPDKDLESIGSSHILKSGSIRALRFLNNDTGLLDFICSDGKPCSIAVKDSFESNKDEPIRKLKADQVHTGFFYGFLAPKRGQLVFKTQTPHLSNELPKRGQECGYDSAPKDKLDKLTAIGKFLEKKSLPSLDLKQGILIQSKEFKNSRTYCILLELVLRYLDKKNVDTKRWFFRSIESYYTKHIFLVKKTSKKVKISKSVTLKEKEVPVDVVAVADVPKNNQSKKSPSKKFEINLDSNNNSLSNNMLDFGDEEVEGKVEVEGKGDVKEGEGKEGEGNAEGKEGEGKEVEVDAEGKEGVEEDESVEKESEESEEGEEGEEGVEDEDKSEDDDESVEELPPIKIKTTQPKGVEELPIKITEDKKYKGDWTYNNVTYYRDGLDVFRKSNGEYIGEYDPSTNTINEDNVFTG